MGLKNSRPLPHARTELHVAPFLQRRIRSWHIDHVMQLALLRYRSLTKRGCIDTLQLATILGIKDETFVHELMQLFAPRTPTRVECMVDATEVLVGLVLVCQAPSMRSRFEAIFDIADVEGTGSITSTDLLVLLDTVGRSITKIFRYCVEPDPKAATIFASAIVHSGLIIDNRLAKAALCTHMLLNAHAVHYVKLCTGENKPKLYVLLEKDAAILGAVQFSDEHAMQTASLRTVRDLVHAQVAGAPCDFAFLSQGRTVKRVDETDRVAWSIVPFALHGSPGLRVHADAVNRKREQPASRNCFAFEYMGAALPRYKKRVYDVAPVYRHRGFRLLGKTGQLCARTRWRVASNWSGEWVYGQAAIEVATKRGVQRQLRSALRPRDDTVVVKSYRGELIALLDDSASVSDTVAEGSEPTLEPSQRLKHDVMSKRTQRQQHVQSRARVIAMDAQQFRDERMLKRKGYAFKASVTRPRTTSDAADECRVAQTTNTVLVHVEDGDVVLPSRVVATAPRHRERPHKKQFAKYEWHVPSRVRLSVATANAVVVKLLSQQVVLAPAACDSDPHKRIATGRFLASTSICLESDEVEVFPVLVLRPIEPQVLVSSCCSRDGSVDDSVGGGLSTARPELLASVSYLTEFEYDLSPQESNYEALLYHINSAAMSDALALNRRDVLGRTMLHDAADFGHTNVLELLLRVRVLLHVSDARGDTALHYAARHGRVRDVSLLLRAGAAPSRRNDDGKSPLRCALEAAAHKLGTDGCGSALLGAPSSPLRQVIDLLWDQYPPSAADKVDRARCVALEHDIYGDLIHASRTGNLLRIQQLLDLDKRPSQQYVNVQLDTLGRTALHEATDAGHTAVVDLLLKVGTDGYVCDQRGQLALHVAAANGNERISACLIAVCPQSLGVQDAVGKTALHVAVERRHTGVATQLLATMGEALAAPERQHIVNLQDVYGFTALHYACNDGSTTLSLALLGAGAHPLVSRVSHTIVNASKARNDLLGVVYKLPAQLQSAGVNGVSVAAVRRWTAEPRDKSIAFDVEAPLELLLVQCRRRPGSVDACKRILTAALTAAARCERSPQVKTARSPLLHLAADVAAVHMSAAVELCRELVRLGVEINMVYSRTGETVLLQECKRVCMVQCQHHDSSCSDNSDDSMTQLALVRVLIELGANVALANDCNGESPLACAAWFGHLALLDVLLEAQPDCDALSTRTYSPLHFAALGGHVACAKMLLAANARVNTVTTGAGTGTDAMQPTSDEPPLFFAVRSTSDAMVQLLLESGAHIGTLCTLRRGITSFGISLDLDAPRRLLRRRTVRMSDEQTDDAEFPLTAVVSALTLALEIARLLAPFSDAAGDLEQPSAAAYITKRSKWMRLGRICFALATALGATTATSGLITCRDVQRASELGYWDVVRVLLTHQLVLSNASTTATMNALHYAAVAGETAIITMLVAAGIDVNCVVAAAPVQPHRLVNRHRATLLPTSTLESSKSSAAPTTPKQRQSVATVREQTLHWNTGALYFALVHGHVETAAKLLVLGANALDTLPHILQTTSDSSSSSDDAVALTAHQRRHKVTFVVTESMRKSQRTQHITTRVGRQSTPSDATSIIHFTRLLARSMNSSVPLLQLAVAAGDARVVELLVHVGHSPFQVVPSAALGGVSEAAIHVAVAHGHMALLRYFAGLAQHGLSRCFASTRSMSLLVTACKHKQLETLAHLLDTISDDDAVGSGDGAGLTVDADCDEVQHALRACAAHQFAAGFRLLLANGARPDLTVLVAALQSVVESVVAETLTAARPTKKRRTVKARPTAASVREILELIVPFASDLDTFFASAAATFDNVLQTLIVCARCEFWFVLERIFVAHAVRFVASSSAYKPVVVRAASCCLVIHRAALHDRVDLVRFFLALGVPADLQLREMPTARSPIWYAASRGCLASFVLLALALERESLGAVVASLDAGSRHHNVALVFRSISDSQSALTPGATCTWRNMSAMSCYDVPRAQTNSLVVQKLMAFARRAVVDKAVDRIAAGSSLLHVACRDGELLSVKALLHGGADVRAVNAHRETPLLIAAERQDARGTVIVQHLLAVMHATAVASDAATISRALVRCVAQPAPCNLEVATMLLAAGANASYVVSPADSSSNVDGGSVSLSAASSAMQLALESMQFACVKLLLDHGAEFTAALVETFLHRLTMTPSTTRTRNWRHFTPQRLHEVECIFALLLERHRFTRAMTNDLLHALIQCASAIAATVARACGLEKRFWRLVAHALATYSHELRAWTAVTAMGERSALHFAVLVLERDIVAQLLDVGTYSVVAVDDARQTPLHVVATTGDAPICALLLHALERERKLFGVDAVDARGRTALHVAVIHGHEAVVELLVDVGGASVELRSTDGLNALLFACKCNRLGVLMALAKRMGGVTGASSSTSALLRTSAGEHAIFVAARYGAFEIVRWLVSATAVAQLDSDGPTDVVVSGSPPCSLAQRTLLHYAAVYGDTAFVRQQLEAPTTESRPDGSESAVDVRDAAGYTPLLYAFGFGRVEAFELLLTAGALAGVAVDHSTEPHTHPYATAFTIASLLEWFAFPGWYTFASTRLPRVAKRQVTVHASIAEDDVMTASIRRWPLAAAASGWTASTWAKRQRERFAPAVRRFESVRTSMRSWRFPQLSLFDFVCDVGDAAMAAFLVRMRLPLLLRRSTYQSQRRTMLLAVRSNHVDVVESLLTAQSNHVNVVERRLAVSAHCADDDGATSALLEATQPTNGLHFHDFVEPALDVAVSRGHEDLALCLLAHWVDAQATDIDAGVFAFQFANVLHVACIRRLHRLIAQLVEYGGEQLVAFHANDGPALVYAVAFGHVDIAAQLLAAGAHYSALHTFAVASVKKWAELGCCSDVQRPHVTAMRSLPIASMEFVGPIEVYDAASCSERLRDEHIVAAFVPSEATSEPES